MSVEIICSDYIEYLQGRDAMPAVFTSLPDAEEIGCGIDDWAKWFVDAAYHCISRTDPRGYCVFYQTDRRAGGVQISKSDLIMQAAKMANARIIWHKIALSKPLGSVDIHRPTYSHIICVSVTGNRGGYLMPDVINAGKKIYPNATGLDACKLVFNFLASHGIKKVYDLFCGRGSIGYVGDRDYGMDMVCVDIDSKQCAKAIDLFKAKTLF